MSIILHMVANTINVATAPTTETFTIVAGTADIKTATLFGYFRDGYGSVSPTGKFLDIYGTDDHQVDALYNSTVGNTVTFSISGDSTVTNSGWTSISIPKSTGGTVTLNRSAATYTNPSTTGGSWVWTGQSGYSVASGTVTITI